MIAYASWRAIGRIVILGVLLWKAATLLLAAIATQLLPLQLAFTIWRDPQYKNFGFGLPYLVSIWGNFDGFYYLGIATRGYFASELPFFPLYPFLIRLLTDRINLPSVLAAQIISMAGLIGSLIVIAKLLDRDRNLAIFPLMVALILTFPTSYSYGASYNDSLFFLLATLSLYWARTGKWWHAGIAGALSTLTRLNGLALFPFLLVELAAVVPLRTVLRDARFHAALLIPAAFAGYLFYIQHVFGSWTKLFSAMSVWGQDRMILPFQVVWRYGKMLLYTPLTQLVWWVALIELGAVVFYVVMLVWSYKKIRFSYWIFFAVSILIPSLTGTFQGMPRYGLHLYPLFLALALLLSQQSRLVKTLYFLVMLIILTFAVVLFTRGFFFA